MFEVFKKSAVWSIAVIAIMMFAAGCSDNDGGGEGDIKIPDNPPAASGGELGKDPKAAAAIAGLPNAAVTAQNVESVFIPELVEALRINWSESRSANRSTRSLPAEGGYEGGKGKWNFSVSGDFSGRAENKGEYNIKWTYDGITESEEGYESGTVRFFDFSNNGRLFFGGAVGYLFTDGKNNHDRENDIYRWSYTIKANGAIEFAGAFKGKIVFNNLVVLGESTEYYDDNSGNWHSGRKYTIKSGSFHIEYNGAKVADLPASLMREFFWIDGERDYGRDPITVDRMPAVPTAPNGSLTDRGGVEVNSDNINTFFRALRAEFDDRGRMPRSANEESGSWNWVQHGKESGFIREAGESKRQINNTGTFRNGTRTVEYSNFSNLGRLYFGGGFGRANTNFWNDGSSSNEYSNEYLINGKVRFTGEFNRTLDFQNFHYKEEWGNNGGRDSVVSGKVMLGSLDITDLYFRFVVRGEWIPDNGDDPITPPSDLNPSELVGTWKADFGSNTTYWYLIFNADGTGMRYDNFIGQVENAIGWWVLDGYLHTDGYRMGSLTIIDWNSFEVFHEEWGVFTFVRYEDELPNYIIP